MEKTIKFTEEELSQIMWEDGIQDDEGNEIYVVVKNKIIDFDQEKNSVEREFTIKEVKTGKKYTAILGQSDWCDQDEENAKVEWEEVIPKKKKQK